MQLKKAENQPENKYFFKLIATINHDCMQLNEQLKMNKSKIICDFCSVEQIKNTSKNTYGRLAINIQNKTFYIKILTWK